MDLDLDPAELEVLGPQVALGVVVLVGEQRGLRREPRERGLGVARPSRRAAA